MGKHVVSWCHLVVTNGNSSHLDGGRVRDLKSGSPQKSRKEPGKGEEERRERTRSLSERGLALQRTMVPAMLLFARQARAVDQEYFPDIARTPGGQKGPIAFRCRYI